MPNSAQRPLSPYRGRTNNPPCVPVPRAESSTSKASIEQVPEGGGARGSSRKRRTETSLPISRTSGISLSEHSALPHQEPSDSDPDSPSFANSPFESDADDDYVDVDGVLTASSGSGSGIRVLEDQNNIELVSSAYT